MFKISLTSEMHYWDAVCGLIFGHIARYAPSHQAANCAQESTYEVKLMRHLHQIILEHLLIDIPFRVE